ncbi:ATP-binding protein [Streptomyces caelestis]|uniref:ATP-binding protein n=1 Tax=Streptomyces caelestis TaxID=36816 RepID=UPI00344F6912
MNSRPASSPRWTCCGRSAATEELRRRRRPIRAGRFPRPKRPEDFRFGNPHVSPGIIGGLKNPVRVQEGRPLVLTGDGGTGRTRLLIGVGTAIAGAVLSVRRTTTAAPVNELAEAERGSRKTR